MHPDLLPLAAALAAFALALVLGFLGWGRPLAAERARAGALAAALEESRIEAGALREARAGLEARLGELALKLEAAETEARRAADLGAELAALRATQAERDRQHAEQLAALRAEFERAASAALEGALRQLSDQAEAVLRAHREAAEAGAKLGQAEIEKLLSPVRDTLARFEGEIKALEQKREQAYGSLAGQLAAVAQGQEAVRAEAARLVAALRGSARASGAWGEAQLRNVLDMAGLSEGIDYTMQTVSQDDEGRRRRPDAVIRLPGGRELVVDAKCSLEHYLAACEATDEAARAEARRRHAAAVRQHVRGLAEKAYWRQFAASADFVVMFVPGENFLAAALEEDTTLLSSALEQRIILAGPTNLLAIARVVAMVWRQEKMAEEARQVAELGAELYESLATMTEHVQRVGRHIGETAGAYNEFIGSLEYRVLARARRFTELGVTPGKKVLPELKPADAAPRPVTRPELLAPSLRAAE